MAALPSAHRANRVIRSLSKGTHLGLLAVITAMPAEARDLALAQGAIAVHAAGAGERAPACEELVVEARDALDNHLIARTQPERDGEGTCRYALSVPAQSAVWLRLRPALVAGARNVPGTNGNAGIPAPRNDHRISGRAVQLRFTIISPNTYFFEPGETKTVPLGY